MSGSRVYGQNCGLARALDVLGERWTLLVIRELNMGPRRYKDLVETLPGMGTNLLAARLKTLEAAKVIRPVLLPPPASVRAYELTEFGKQLRPMLAQLAVWGLQLDVADDDDAESRASWTLLPMVATADPVKIGSLDAIVELRVGAEVMWIKADSNGLDLASGAAVITPDLVVETDVPTFIALSEGSTSPAQAIKNNSVTVRGDRKLLTRFFRVFRLPRRQDA
ncbi:winged helix-turn-helix transcriptional regulator [Nocardia sp. NBC_00881]|uniref:winged helix-turn-helix transcriptional regulator n=1 Tax=Nocardia sp. NBC_00881 TaxID=2975995 RepID=UPI00386C44D1|nr:winged helix-turn-helix transcriptional regulator [Nocardia sp. NBC_00881]